MVVASPEQEEFFKDQRSISGRDPKSALARRGRCDDSVSSGRDRLLHYIHG